MIGQRIDQADKEMTRAHRGIADAQREDRICRVGVAQGSPLIVFGILGIELAKRRAKRIQPFGYERFERFVEDQADQCVGV
jgi:hypothetical protein